MSTNLLSNWFVTQTVTEGSKHQLLPLILARKVKGQGQICPLLFNLQNQLRIHYHIKLHQNLTCSFQVVRNYLIEKYENGSQGQRLRSIIKM